MNTLSIAVLSIAVSVAAQFALKAGMTSASTRSALSDPFSPAGAFAIFSNPFVLGGFALYALGAVVWLAVLARWDVSKAYPLVGLGLAMSVVLGALLGESVGAGRVLGVALICAGVVLVARS